ncbi:MAG TPA: RNA 2',3'-cyclic phosphodiesterase [Planctomycetota bacterium]|nr:RNA 2',3'-cyclic phosphodiesterase [Planctomycetota bacterium]
MRTFLAIDLSPAAKVLAHQMQQSLRGIRGLRLTRPEQCHLTLKFLGEIDEPQRERFSKALSLIRQPTFQLSLTHLGVFPNERRPRVIWLGVSDEPALRTLASAVDLATNSITADKPFAPHITLARVAEPGVRIDLGLLTPGMTSVQDGGGIPGLVRVTEFVLYQSVPSGAGMEHRVVRRFEFAVD